MNFNGFYGNSRAKEYLSAAFSRASLPHALLLTGERGIGKHTLAKIIAGALVCNGENVPCGKCSSCMKVQSGSHPDIIELGHDSDAVKVDEIRDLKRDALLRPNDGERKVYIINRADMLTHQAQDALLKILEEPPHFTFFILLCYNYSDLLPTVVSRVAHIALSPLSDSEMRALIREKKPEISEDELSALVSTCGGICNFLTDDAHEKALGLATDIASALASRDELLIFKGISAVEKHKKDGLLAVCNELLILLRDACALASGASCALISRADEKFAKSLAENFSASICSDMADCIVAAKIGLSQNIGVSHIIGSLICGLSELAV